LIKIDIDKLLEDTVTFVSEDHSLNKKKIDIDQLLEQTIHW